jgi:hypothetical protein
MKTTDELIEQNKNLLHALRELSLSNSPSIDKSYVEEMLENLMKEVLGEDGGRGNGQ